MSELCCYPNNSSQRHYFHKIHHFIRSSVHASLLPGFMCLLSCFLLIFFFFLACTFLFFTAIKKKAIVWQLGLDSTEANKSQWKRSVYSFPFPVVHQSCSLQHGSHALEAGGWHRLGGAGALAGAAVPSGGRWCHPGCSCGPLEVGHGCCISQIVLWCVGGCTSKCCWTQPVSQKVNKATRPGASYMLVNIEDNKPHTFLSVWSKVRLRLCSEKCMKCRSQALSAKETLLLFLLDAFLQSLLDHAPGAVVQKMLWKSCSGATWGWINILACMGACFCLPRKTIHAMRVHCPRQGITTAELPSCSFRTGRVLDRGELSVEERAKWYSIFRK